MQLPTLLWLCCYLFVVGGLSAFGLHRWYLVALFWKNYRNPPQPLGRFEKLPLITVQLPIYNEQMVVSRLVKAVAALDYPRELLQIQILDDSTDETQQICEAEAAQLRGRIQGMVRDGQSDDKIKQVLIDEFGPRILALPEGTQRVWLFWTPWLIGALGLAAVFAWMQRARHRPTPATGLPPAELPDGWDRD